MCTNTTHRVHTQHLPERHVQVVITVSIKDLTFFYIGKLCQLYKAIKCYKGHRSHYLFTQLVEIHCRLNVIMALQF